MPIIWNGIGKPGVRRQNYCSSTLKLPHGEYWLYEWNKPADNVLKHVDNISFLLFIVISNNLASSWAIYFFLYSKNPSSNPFNIFFYSLTFLSFPFQTLSHFYLSSLCFLSLLYHPPPFFCLPKIQIRLDPNDIDQAHTLKKA